MIRPAAFGYNTETALNNVFQHRPVASEEKLIASRAIAEFDAFVDVLRQAGVQVTVIGDKDPPVKPDAIFPNNWISFHEPGTIVTYPMYSPLRRQERRQEILDEISNQFRVTDILRFEGWEDQNRFLEGTGSMVLDRSHQIAYACISERTDSLVLQDWCEKMKYTPVTFHSISQGKPIYHTNVMMALASQLAVVCLESVPDETERRQLRDHLERHHTLLEISLDQVQQFAGNMLAVLNHSGKELMVMSERARNSLTEDQVAMIQHHCDIISSPIPTIEDIGGGSARCMMAEVFLSSQ